jgi:hypothetical protein
MEPIKEKKHLYLKDKTLNTGDWVIEEPSGVINMMSDAEFKQNFEEIDA